MRIPKRIKKLRTPTGFDEVFEKEMSNYDTYEATFEALNKEFKQWFDEPRYKNYEAYRQSRRQRLKM